MNFEELTITDLHNGFRAGTLTSAMLTQWYLGRIAESGLNAVVSVNPAAVEEAEAADRRFATDGITGPPRCSGVDQGPGRNRRDTNQLRIGTVRRLPTHQGRDRGDTTA